MEKICSVSECTREHRARGYCSTHYTKAVREGRIEIILPRRKDDLCAKCRKEPRASKNHAYCKKCHADYNRTKRQNLSQEDRDAINEKARQRRLEDPLRFKGYTLKKYNITLDDYNNLLKQQGGGCAICGTVPSEDEWLAVDHDHGCCPETLKSCGQCVRGLLCATCNNGIGRFKDDVTLLRSAISYLQSPPANL